MQSSNERVRITVSPETGAEAPIDQHIPARDEQSWLRLHLNVWSSLLRCVGAMLIPSAGAGVILLALGCIAFTRPGAWAGIATLLVGAALTVRQGVSRQATTIVVLAATVNVSAVDYLAWRWGVVNWASWWVALPLFAAELFGALHTLGLQYTMWPRKELLLMASEDPTRAPIFIFIPTVNEGVSILEPTLRGALAARVRYLAAYPHADVTIVVCNDGRVAGAPNWQDTEVLARQIGVACITRTVGGGAKAGNIEHARQQFNATRDALVVIFDADQIAEPDFLLKTVPPFADPAIGWVQTGQYYRNLDNPVARWANDQQALFYRILCPGKSTQNAAFICGTNVMLRAAALDEIGGLPQTSVTEDFVASIELHPRWRSLFLPDVLAQGLGPMDFQSYFVQQGRWATGTLSVLRSHWRALFLPSWGGLRQPQRLQYALASTHYLCGVRDLIYIIAPVIFLITGIPAVRGAYLSTFLWHFIPYWLASQVAFWHLARGKSGLRGIVIGFGSFPVLIFSLLTVIRGRPITFAVTDKRRSTGRARWPLLPHAVGLLACAAALIMAVGFKGERGSVVISALWVMYAGLMLGSTLWLGLANSLATHVLPRPTERYVRWRQRFARPARLVLAPALAVAMILTVLAFMVRPNLFVGPPARFQLAGDMGSRPYLGVWLPAELLASRPAELEHQLGLSFAIVGRTQVSSDSFDYAWANTLAAHGTRPWITLLLAAPGGSPLDAALPGIINGVQDDALRRWARDMQRFGRPIYLTILPQVDQSWQPSSAIANGGRPQDVPLAWQHVRAIFRQEGARNVAWVWGPADPARDEAVAPPRATIDAVLLRLTALPGTAWPNPATAVAAVSRRYPTAPLFVQVSAAGQPARKAEWLREVGMVIAHTPNVYALMYYESGPSSRVVLTQHTPWSLASDPIALHGMQAAARFARVRTSVSQRPGRMTAPAHSAIHLPPARRSGILTCPCVMERGQDTSQANAFSSSEIAQMSDVLFNPNPVRFAQHAVGTATEQTIHLVNLGSAPLMITDVAITGSAAGDYAESSICVGATIRLTEGPRDAPSASASRPQRADCSVPAWLSPIMPLAPIAIKTCDCKVKVFPRRPKVDSAMGYSESLVPRYKQL